MYIVINEDKIKYAKTLKSINKKLKTAFKKDEFKRFNADYVLNVSNADIDFKRDTNELNRIFVNKLYKKDFHNLINYGLFVIVIILMLITITSISGVNEQMVNLISQLEKVVIQ